ncbi:MAG: zinc ribbon domain-containing protein [Lachnospiraceae bacterium]|nr:zinc ribbon domain-containing protein [Lachnospiraceae bacterium]
MDFFSKIGNKITDTTELSKLKNQITAEENLIKEKYTEIGKKFYEENPDLDNANYNDLFKAINESKAKIEQYNNQIILIKGTYNCPTCGTEVSIAAGFCVSCGTKLEPPKGNICPTCGVKIEKGATFCASCGTRLVEEVVEEGNKCPSCGAKVDPSALFCTSCGTKMAVVKRCNACGTQVPDDAVFCENCGAKL